MDDGDPFDFDQLFGPNNRFRDFFAGTPLIFQIFEISTAGPFFSDPAWTPVPSPSGSGRLDDPLHGGGVPIDMFPPSSTQQITVSDEEGSLQWTEKDGLRFSGD